MEAERPVEVAREVCSPARVPRKDVGLPGVGRFGWLLVDAVEKRRELGPVVERDERGRFK